MGKTVFCRKYQQELDGLDIPPMPGKVGEEILANISKKAWGEWMGHQTTLINEKRLNLMSLTDREYLNEQRERFFSGKEVDKADGYIPPSE